MKIALWCIATLIVAGLACATAPTGAREARADQGRFRHDQRRKNPEGRLPGDDPETGDHVQPRRRRSQQSRRNGELKPARRQEANRQGPRRDPRRKQEVVTGNTVNLADAALDPNLDSFTVFAWTSTSRNITNPYDLVFHLRPANDEMSKKEAAAVWNTIAESTLKGDDLTNSRSILGAKTKLPPDAGEDVA